MAAALLMMGALVTAAVPLRGMVVLHPDEDAADRVGEGARMADAAFSAASDRASSSAVPATTATATTAAAPRMTTGASSARAQAVFSRTLAAYLKQRTGTAVVMAVDTATGVMVSSGAHVASYTASVVKVDILAVLLLQRQDDGRMPSSAEESLARRMIVASDNDAASQLWERIGGADGLAAANRRLGLEETVPGSGGLWGLTRTTAADQIRLLSVVTGSGGAVVRSAVPGRAGALGKARRAFAVHLMEQVIDDQVWGVSAAAAGGGTALKNGWLSYSKDGYRWLVNSVGRVRTAKGSTLLVAVLTRRSPDLAYGVTTVERISRLAAAALDGA
jgi:hypothetical protein